MQQCQALCAVWECPDNLLGTLKSPAIEECENISKDGAIVIKGVVIPERVAEQLRQLGLPLSWYNAGELEDAVEACAIDGELIDDPDGMDFRDKLSLTDSEKQQKAAKALTLISNSP